MICEWLLLKEENIGLWCRNFVHSEIELSALQRYPNILRGYVVMLISHQLTHRITITDGAVETIPAQIQCMTPYVIFITCRFGKFICGCVWLIKFSQGCTDLSMKPKTRRWDIKSSSRSDIFEGYPFVWRHSVSCLTDSLSNVFAFCVRVRVGESFTFHQLMLTSANAWQRDKRVRQTEAVKKRY